MAVWWPCPECTIPSVRVERVKRCAAEILSCISANEGNINIFVAALLDTLKKPVIEASSKAHYKKMQASGMWKNSMSSDKQL